MRQMNHYRPHFTDETTEAQLCSLPKINDSEPVLLGF